ncbi:hypothetical protein GMORB2_5856 [Geosmithia morbida]|uniref:WHIM1 domain-containing protein n=1 Tax=Geosmithia morbida TaxID=1094350 RepID=A0A9P4YWH3_9HYPO|nr:uncharacterized protein GMORB2_5856 [Geosmithia morbida]KAF4124140.1 hypothetical protein GMORB2_5856 [Geosmithia morbida]
MASDNESSELSSLSSLSPAPSDDELEVPSDLEEPKPTKKEKEGGILSYFPKASEASTKEPSPPPQKRSPSPEHEYVLADNPEIAFIVMFRSRFSDAFPKSLPHFGPQDLERDVVQGIPGDRVEQFLCALLGLLLNRKQDVKSGHYGRALEDAITTHKSEWPPSWEGKNPLSGGKNFNTMDPTERLTLLRNLILWTMSSSEAVKTLINQSYKQNRHEDDLNQPRSVQPWGTDGEKRRYFLIEGQDDTAFRVYRESNALGKNRTWWSVAGSMEDLTALSHKLEAKDGGPKAKKFAQKIRIAMTRFEAGEEKRRRREYRQMQKERFKRPEPGFSMYEGRTRGKRIKYTYSDDEDFTFSDSTNRRSARNTGASTPAEVGPVTTSRGRQIRAPPRLNAATSEDSAADSIQGDASEFDKEDSNGPTGRPRRSAARNNGSNGWVDAGPRSRRNTSAGSDEDDVSQGEFGDDEEDDAADEHIPEEEDEDEEEFDEDVPMLDDELDNDVQRHQSLVVTLEVTPPKLKTALFSTVSTATEPRPSDLKTAEVKGGDVSPAPETMAVDDRKDKIPEHSASPTEPLVERSENLTSTPLAFRGSPEKVQEQQPVAPPGQVCNGD